MAVRVWPAAKIVIQLLYAKYIIYFFYIGADQATEMHSDWRNLFTFLVPPHLPKK